jgi:hypothetical protein
MYVVLAYLSLDVQHFSDRCGGEGFNGWNILFLMHRCALFHYFSFLIRWVSLKESQFIYVKFAQSCNSFKSYDEKSGRQIQSLIGIELSLTIPQHRPTDMTEIFPFHRCVIF